MLRLPRGGRLLELLSRTADSAGYNVTALLST